MKKILRRVYAAFKDIKNIPDWISAITNAGLLTLGIYGIFYTNLPEALVSSLNTEVSQLRAEKSLISIQLKSLEQDKENISEEKNHLAESMKQLINARNVYIERTMPLISEEFYNSLQKTIEENEGHLEKLEHIKDAYDYIKKVKDIDDQIEEIKNDTTIFRSDWRTPENYKIVSDLIKKKHDIVPEPFARDYLLWNMTTEGWCRDCDPTEKTYEKHLDAFKSEFSKQPISGIDLVKNLELQKLSLLTEDDRMIITTFMNSYLTNNSEIYKYAVTIKITDEENNEKISKEASLARKHLEAVKSDLPAFKMKLDGAILALKKDLSNYSD